MLERDKLNSRNWKDSNGDVVLVYTGAHLCDADVIDEQIGSPTKEQREHDLNFRLNMIDNYTDRLRELIEEIPMYDDDRESLRILTEDIDYQCSKIQEEIIG